MVTAGPWRCCVRARGQILVKKGSWMGLDGSTGSISGVMGPKWVKMGPKWVKMGPKWVIQAKMA